MMLGARSANQGLSDRIANRIRQYFKITLARYEISATTVNNVSRFQLAARISSTSLTWILHLHDRASLVVDPATTHQIRLNIVFLSSLLVLHTTSHNARTFKKSRAARSARYALLELLATRYHLAVLIFSIPPTVQAPLISRITPSASISSSAAKSATAVQPVSSDAGAPLPISGKPRREVILPSQEKKEGAMQFALYVGSQTL